MRIRDVVSIRSELQCGVMEILYFHPLKMLKVTDRFAYLNGFFVLFKSTSCYFGEVFLSKYAF